MAEDAPVDLEIEDEELLDEDDEDIEADPAAEEETSLQDIHEGEVLAEQASAALEEDDEFIVKAMEGGGEETSETLSLKIPVKRPGEFTCSVCFLVKHPSQLAEGTADVCVDCA